MYNPRRCPPNKGVKLPGLRPAAYAQAVSRTQAVSTVLETEHEITKHLESGERLLWTGAPHKGFLLRKSDAFQIPFSLMWGGFAIFWETTVLRSGGPLFFVLWGIPFVAIGLYLIFGRFWVDAKSRSVTAYALTDRRVLIVSGILSRSVKSLPLRTLSELTLEENRDGTGTITFGSANPLMMFGGGANWPGGRRYQTPGFESIVGASEVYRRIREAQKALDPKSG